MFRMFRIKRFSVTYVALLSVSKKVEKDNVFFGLRKVNLESKLIYPFALRLTEERLTEESADNSLNRFTTATTSSTTISTSSVVL